MAIKKQDDNGNKKKYMVIALIIAFLLVLNYYFFVEKVSSNKELINNYEAIEDPMEQVRNPAVAGLFYSANKKELIADIDSYLGDGIKEFEGLPKILIVPHAGYVYSGKVAAKAYSPLKKYAKKIKKVILLGPSHNVSFDGVALSSNNFFLTPLGRVKIDKDINQQLATKKGFVYNNKAHKNEHSLEVQLPFLQRILKNFTIVPLVYGKTSPKDLASSLLPYVNRDDVLLVVSADLSHYHSYDEAQKMDIATLAKIESKEANVDNHHSCGASGINTALEIAKKINLLPKVLTLINSGDVMGDKSSVVGYGAWAFEEGETIALSYELANLQDFADEYGQEMLKIAKKSLEMAVLSEKKYKVLRQDYADKLFDKGASFVTLEKNDELRGCVGSLVAEEAIALDIAQNTYSAALEDNRFLPILPEELDEILVSISLLTSYEEIDFENEGDLLTKIKANEDGLLILDGSRQALFLPSVWKKMPNKQDFWESLKLKAGISPRYWSDNIQVYRFWSVEVK